MCAGWGGDNYDKGAEREVEDDEEKIAEGMEKKVEEEEGETVEKEGGKRRGKKD